MTQYTWTGGGSNDDWTNAQNWSGNGSPSTGYPGGPNGAGGSATNDTVIFPNGAGTINVTAPPSTFRMTSFQVGATTTVNLNGPGVVSVAQVGGSSGYHLTLNNSTITSNVGSSPTDPIGQGPNGVNLFGSGGTLTLENGGEYYAFNNNGLSTVNFGTGGGDFIWVGGGNTGGWSATAITGFNANSHFINGPIDQTAYATHTFSATATINGSGPSYTVVVRDTTSNTVVITYPNVTPAPGFDMNNLTATPSIDQFNNNTNYYAVDLSCFLEGTLILTAGGEVAVETLKAGDMVITLVNGVPTQRAVKWLGHRSIDASKLPGGDAYPIRIRAGAMGDNLPVRDLLVTPEHCVLIDGGLIPARMLVNGGSIIIDRSIANYTYYHVELEQHAILLAEGLPTESYLDTGNRGNFADTETPSLHPSFETNAGHAKWGTDSAAPLAVDRASVEPVWRRLAERAVSLGLEAAVSPSLTDDPDLHLVTDAGWEIRPVMTEQRRYAFAVPEGAKSVRLVSRASRPSDVVGPFVDDRRMLGIKVARIEISHEQGSLEMQEHLTSADLAGWHAAEGDGRWTDGNAVLPIEIVTKEKPGPVTLAVQVVATGPYLAAETARRAEWPVMLALAS